MDTFIWEMSDFPKFQYNIETIFPFIEKIAEKIGAIENILSYIQVENQTEILIEFLSNEALNTSAIEGNYFSREDVMSSIRNNLGLNKSPINIRDKAAQDVANLMLQVRADYNTLLTLEMIKQWHSILMKNERKPINIGMWRSGIEPMQVISGDNSALEIHYQAPPSKDLDRLMLDFIQWYQGFDIKDKGLVTHAIVKSALAHLYFETLHPFEDGNGRIGRAISEKAIAETFQKPLFLSLSTAIEKYKAAYYAAMKQGQRNLEVTNWIIYFAKTIFQALENTQVTISFTLQRTAFFDKFKNKLNERQEKALRKMFKNANETFEGGMTAKKYMAITRASKATATRDLQELYEMGALTKEGKGRSIHYHIKIT